MLNLQLAHVRSTFGFENLRDQVKAIGGLLEEKSAIPMVRDQMDLIQEVQTDEWWQNVTIPMLETVRRRLRDLIKLIEKQQRKPIYTDFEDFMGTESEVELPGLGSGRDFANFRMKAQAFLRAHQDNITIRKLRTNKALTESDLAELEWILIESGVGARKELDRAKTEAHGLGLFVRSLVGMDREAAKEAMGDSCPTDRSAPIRSSSSTSSSTILRSMASWTPACSTNPLHRPDAPGAGGHLQL